MYSVLISVCLLKEQAGKSSKEQQLKINAQLGEIYWTQCKCTMYVLYTHYAYEALSHVSHMT